MIQFATYWPLLLLPLPWLVLRWFPAAEAAQSSALFVPFYYRFTQLISSTSIKRNVIKRKPLLITIWCMLIMSLMGPEWLGPAQAVSIDGRNMVMAVDISASMQTPDMKLDQMPVDRLSVLKEMGKRFVAGRSGDRVGLIVFGTKAFLQAPLTFDLQTVSAMLDDATIGLAGSRTAIGDAIGLAVVQLKQLPSNHRILILLTDGASNGGSINPESAIQLAKRYHVKIYTIGIGADKMMVPGLLGPQFVNPAAELDEKGLKKIASETGGRYFRATDSTALVRIYDAINLLEPTVTSDDLLRPVTDFYYFFLLAALMLSLLMAIQYYRQFHDEILKEEGQHVG